MTAPAWWSPLCQVAWDELSSDDSKTAALWIRLFDSFYSNLGRECDALSREVARLDAMIAAWTAKPLRTVDEVEGPKADERAAKKAAKAAEQAAKLAAKVVSYQTRLATAVRRKTASTIADIFESAPRQLTDMTGGPATRADAFALLDRTAIFQAFGLDPAQPDSFRSANGSILGSMRYNFDKTLMWPESLR